jgi:hypothetical protein
MWNKVFVSEMKMCCINNNIHFNAVTLILSGASLIIYNVQFGVVQSRHHFKLFASPPRLWCAGTNLLIATAHNLVVVPYRLEAQRLSAMVGTHCSGSAQAEHDSDVQELHHTLCSNWVANGTGKNAPSRSNQQIPEALKEQLRALEAEGCCQSMLVYCSIIPFKN